jgi:hypothetical protein
MKDGVTPIGLLNFARAYAEASVHLNATKLAEGHREAPVQCAQTAWLPIQLLTTAWTRLSHVTLAYSRRRSLTAKVKHRIQELDHPSELKFARQLQERIQAMDRG